MQKTPYVFPIIGGRKVEHLMANIEALKISLSNEQIKYIESILPFDPGFPMYFIVSRFHFLNSHLVPIAVFLNRATGHLTGQFSCWTTLGNGTVGHSSKLSDLVLVHKNKDELTGCRLLYSIVKYRDDCSDSCKNRPCAA